jgi:hypothetical protein
MNQFLTFQGYELQYTIGKIHEFQIGIISPQHIAGSTDNPLKGVVGVKNA